MAKTWFLAIYIPCYKLSADITITITHAVIKIPIEAGFQAIIPIRA